MEGVPRWWITNLLKEDRAKVWQLRHPEARANCIVKLMMYNSHSHELSIMHYPIDEMVSTSKLRLDYEGRMSDSDPETVQIWFMNRPIFIQDNTTEQESTDAYGYSIKLEEITVSASATPENAIMRSISFSNTKLTCTLSMWISAMLLIPKTLHWSLPKNRERPIFGGRGCSPLLPSAHQARTPMTLDIY